MGLIYDADEYYDEVARPDTFVTIKVRNHEEYAKEKDFNEDEKYNIRGMIARLEQDLIYYSRDGMELRMLPNTIEDIVHDLKILYKHQNKVYCAKKGEYYYRPEGLRRV